MNTKISPAKRITIEEEYFNHIADLIEHPTVKLMDNFIHHSNITTLEHCLFVSFMSFKISRKLRLDAKVVARGALLHDLYLYDWHETIPPEGLHGFTHAAIALRNASAIFDLSNIEVDIISKHMWPLNIRWPSFKESLLVCLVDKYCALAEIVSSKPKKRLETIKQTILDFV